MRFPHLPDQRRRLLVAEVNGEVEWLASGPDQLALEPAVAYLHRITTDPVVFGHVLGTYLAYSDREPDRYRTAVELLRAAGADEGQAERKAAWLRQEIAEGRHLF